MKKQVLLALQDLGERTPRFLRNEALVTGSFRRGLIVHILSTRGDMRCWVGALKAQIRQWG